MLGEGGGVFLEAVQPAIKLEISIKIKKQAENRSDVFLMRTSFKRGYHKTFLP
jgi:hypothetical protein